MSTVKLPLSKNLVEYIKIQCHNCERRIELENVEALSKIKCPDCETELRVPLRVEQILLEQVINTDENIKFYRGTDLRLNRPAVIKVINKELTTPGEIYSFGVGSLDHENISSIYSVSIIDDTYYLVTENIIGQTLEHFLNIGDDFEAEDVLGVAQQVTEALKEAASKGVNHGHLSLDSIWVSNEGDCKVADFGIRHRLYTQDLDGAEKAVKNAIYFNDRVDTPEKADLYSFGVCLHKLACGEFPIDGNPILGDSILPSWFNKIIEKLLKAEISSFEELEDFLDNPEKISPKTVEVKASEIVKELDSPKPVKISTPPANSSRKASPSQAKKVNELKRKLLLSRVFFAAFLAIAFLFATSRYLPTTALGKFSESLLNNTLDKAFAAEKAEPKKDEFENVMDLLEEKK